MKGIRPWMPRLSFRRKAVWVASVARAASGESRRRTTLFVGVRLFFVRRGRRLVATEYPTRPRSHCVKRCVFRFIDSAPCFLLPQSTINALEMQLRAELDGPGPQVVPPPMPPPRAPREAPPGKPAREVLDARGRGAGHARGTARGTGRGNAVGGSGEHFESVGQRLGERVGEAVALVERRGGEAYRGAYRSTNRGAQGTALDPVAGGFADSDAGTRDPLPRSAGGVDPTDLQYLVQVRPRTALFCCCRGTFPAVN